MTDKDCDQLRAYELFTDSAKDILCQAAQLIGGWNHDGIWSEWDQSVRDKISSLQKEAEKLRPHVVKR